MPKREASDPSGSKKKKKKVSIKLKPKSSSSSSSNVKSKTKGEQDAPADELMEAVLDYGGDEQEYKRLKVTASLSPPTFFCSACTSSCCTRMHASSRMREHCLSSN